MPDDKTTKESDREFAKKFSEKDILSAVWTLAVDQWMEAGTEGLLDLNKRTTSIEGWTQEATHILEELKEKTKKINRWMDVMDTWTATASDSIEELEDRVQKLEEYEARYREGRVEERVAALEQIYNKSKQAPPLADPWSTIKPQPGPSFYYCPACGSRQITGSYHYCPGKVYPPEGYGHGSAATYMTGCGQGGEAPHLVNLPDLYKGAQEVPDVPHPARGGAATECGPESAPVPAPPLGGQTEEEIRKAAQKAAGKPGTIWFYRNY